MKRRRTISNHGKAAAGLFENKPARQRAPEIKAKFRASALRPGREDLYLRICLSADVLPPDPAILL
jgi:hypothetical protein